MEDITISFDVDETLADRESGLLTRVNDPDGAFPNAALSPADFTEWQFTVPGTDRGVGEIINHYLTTDPSYIMEMGVMSGARDVVSWADGEPGVTVQIVTHRPPETHEWTRSWLAENGIPYDVFVEDVPRNKSVVAGDVLVDDRPQNVQGMVEAGQTGVLLLRRYNHRVVSEEGGLLSASDVFQDVSVESLWRDPSRQWEGIREILEGVVRESRDHGPDASRPVV